MATKIIIDEEEFDKLFQEARDKMELAKLKEQGYKLHSDISHDSNTLYRQFIYEMFGLKDKLKKSKG